MRESADGASKQQVAVVGGGIAGMYAAWQLAREGYEVQLLETKDVLGGRIETLDLRPCPADDGANGGAFKAEMGPMRFELPLQPLFADLCAELGITFDSFPGPAHDRIPNGEPLETDERNPRTGENLGPLDLLRLGVYRMFGKSPYIDTASGNVRLPPDDQAWLDDLSDADGGFDRLRREALLGTGTSRQPAHPEPLYGLGFWNALYRCLSPAAVRRIQNDGTFYHLFETNPSAVEWGIFWLRLFKLAADEELSTIPTGVASVTERLTALLEREFSQTVTLRTSHHVTAVREAPEGPKVVVDFTDKSSETACVGQLEVDNVILALPQEPLRALSAPFPLQIRTDIEGVQAFTLLKIFTVVRTPPWWEEPPKPQMGARFIPTREVHYFPVGRLDDNMLVLLYMDKPSASFWQVYVTNPANHDRAEVNANAALRGMIVSSLVKLYVKWADDAAVDASGPRLEIQQGDDVWRLLRDTFSQNLPEILPADFAPVNAREARRQILLGDRQAVTDFVASTTGDYAIRDWSRKPFGAGCHAWGPGSRSWEIRDRLRGFTLSGDGRPNVHVCGEAFSDYQGFIEGSLRSASDAVATITGATSH